MFCITTPTGHQKSKRMPILTDAQAAEKNPINDENYTIRHGVPIPASIQCNHYLMNIVINGTFPYHSMEKKTHIYQTLSQSELGVNRWLTVVVKEVLCTKNYPLPYHLIRLGQLYIAMSLIKA